MAGDLYLAISTIIEWIGSGQLPSEDREIELTKKARDTIRLKEMMATIDSSVIDQLPPCDSEIDFIPALVQHYRCFRDLVSASNFLIYDDHLNRLMESLHGAWKECIYVMLAAHLDELSPDDEWDDETIMERSTLSEDEMMAQWFYSRQDTVHCFGNLLRFVHEQYPEIDIRETDSLAREALRRRNQH